VACKQLCFFPTKSEFALMIHIIGAGITGLVTAAYLKKAGHKVQVYDSKSEVGGNIKSLHTGTYLLELGPNSLVLNDALYAFLEEWKLDKHILMANPKAKYRFILKNGRYRKLPTGPASLLRSRTFSTWAKKQLLKERRLPPQFEVGDTVDSFFRKRLGDEWTDYVVHPFISGVFAGNPKELLIDKSFPRIIEMEQNHGSLLKGMMANRKKQVHRGTMSLEGGLQLLPKTLADYLNVDIHLDHPLLAIRKNMIEGYTLQFKQKEIQASTIVLAIPAYQVGRLLKDMAPGIHSEMAEVEYPPVSMIYTVYKRKALGHRLDGFGALHNHLEECFSLGSIFSSSVFPGRCPKDEVLLTTFVGGDMYPERARLSDEELKKGVDQELKSLIGAKADPVFQQVQRWPRAIPQYKPSALAAQREVSALENKGIYLGGNWVGGISVPNCIENGKELARKIAGQGEFIRR